VDSWLRLLSEGSEIPGILFGHSVRQRLENPCLLNSACAATLHLALEARIVSAGEFGANVREARDARCVVWRDHQKTGEDLTLMRTSTCLDSLWRTILVTHRRQRSAGTETCLLASGNG